MLVRRLVLVLSTVVVTSLGFVVGVVAAGGGLAPGSYTFTNFGASATFGGGKGIPTPQPTFFLSVNQGLNSFEGQDSQGSGSVSNTTMVLLTMIDTSGNATSGCFQVAPTDFKVSRNLQSASLHTTLSTINQCGGKGQPIGPLRPAGILPAAGSIGEHSPECLQVHPAQHRGHAESVCGWGASLHRRAGPLWWPEPRRSRKDVQPLLAAQCRQKRSGPGSDHCPAER